MTRIDGSWQMAVVFMTLTFCCSVLCNGNFRSSYIRNIKACSLAEFSQEFHQESESDCRYACLKLQDAAKCAAYQWDAASGSCTIQDTLHITDAPPEATVGVMMDSDPPVITCADDNACPENHLCQDPACEGLSRKCVPTDCSVVLAVNPASQSGVYNIFLTKTQEFIPVWCDMDTDGGGWTVFLKRLDGSVDFYRGIAAYKQGFGNVSGEYWLGLDVLHAMTSANNYQLRADVSDWEGDSMYSLHASMGVADETDNYRLILGTFLGGDGDSFGDVNGMMFTTKDSDHDERPSNNCAVDHRAGFWFKACANVLPTSTYYFEGPKPNIEDVYYGIQWRTWSKYQGDRYYSMKTVELKLRP